MYFLIVSLGNPGTKYSQTRHNIGQMVLPYLSFSSHLTWKSKFKGEYALYKSDGHDWIFLRPMTYMNLSGESVVAACKFFKIPIENILVVHDELDFNFGRCSFKNGGGLAGHNGLKSIKQHLGSGNFYRLRLGIGRPQHGDVAAYVLSKFQGDEEMALSQFLKLGAEAIESYMKQGYQQAAQLYNQKSK